jgi:hypothetical protein
MKKLNLFILLFSVLTGSTYAQGNLDWLNQIGGADSDSGYDVKVDNSGNVYVAGTFTGTVDFDPSSATNELIATGGVDVFLAKYDAEGNYQWAVKMGDNQDDSDGKIALDDNGNIYVLANYHYTNTALNVHGFMLLKYDSSGNQLFYNRIVNQNGRALNICYYNDHIYIVGGFADNADFDFGTGRTTLTSNGGQDIFVAKYDTNANLIWVESFGSTSEDKATAIFANDNGVYMTGVFTGTVDFDYSSSTYNLSTSDSYADIFVLHLNESGGFVWVKKIGGTYNDIASNIIPFGLNKLLISGYFVADCDFNPSTQNHILHGGSDYDGFVLKLDSYGNYNWVKQFVSDKSLIRGLAKDNAGNIYLSGYFQGDLDADPSDSNVENLTSVTSNAYDIFQIKLNSYGELLWANSYGSNSHDVAISIAVDNNSNAIYTTGFFDETVDFGPGTSTDNYTSNGDHDIFVQKLTQGTGGITQNNFDNHINIFPNPFHNNLNISSKSKIYKVVITDLAGKQIFAQNEINKNSLNLILHQKQGVYFIKVTTEKGMRIQKLILE